MKSEKYPFVKCLNPRSFVNPHTGEKMVVPCCSCPMCQLRKSYIMAQKCKLESLSHKYTMFVTLTYDNAHLPLMSIEAHNRYLDDCGEVVDNYSAFKLIDQTERLGTQGTQLGTTTDYTFATTTLARKCNTPSGLLPHLSKYDLQLFIKRLRKNVSQYSSEKIRYYAVGEMGPIHFRPHYHLLVWFSDKKIFTSFRKMVRKSWQYGRISAEKSLGNCADYTAKYVNGNGPLPSIFKELGTRPFSTHSTHLGEEILKASYSSVYENEYTTIVRRSIPDISTDSDVVLWRSLKAHFFPKCKGYATKSERVRLYTYKVFSRASVWTKKDRVSEIAPIIFDYCLGYIFRMNVYTDDYDGSLIRYFVYSVGINKIDFLNDKDGSYVEYCLRAIYMELRLSKHFLSFVCNNDANLIYPRYKQIEEFWKKEDYENLKNQCIDEEKYMTSNYYDADFGYNFFYHNLGFDVEAYKQSKSFMKYRAIAQKQIDDSVKHKKLNDLNKAFNI